MTKGHQWFIDITLKLFRLTETPSLSVCLSGVSSRKDVTHTSLDKVLQQLFHSFLHDLSLVTFGCWHIQTGGWKRSECTGNWGKSRNCTKKTCRSNELKNINITSVEEKRSWVSVKCRHYFITVTELITIKCCSGSQRTQDHLTLIVPGSLKDIMRT